MTDSIVSQGQLSQDEFVDKATEDSKMTKSVLTNIFERRMTSIAQKKYVFIHKVQQSFKSSLDPIAKNVFVYRTTVLRLKYEINR